MALPDAADGRARLFDTDIAESHQSSLPALSATSSSISKELYTTSVEVAGCHAVTVDSGIADLTQLAAQAVSVLTTTATEVSGQQHHATPSAHSAFMSREDNSLSLIPCALDQESSSVEIRESRKRRRSSPNGSEKPLSNREWRNERNQLRSRIWDQIATKAGPVKPLTFRDNKDYPPCTVSLPHGLTFKDICRRYPNHLEGDLLVEMSEAGMSTRDIVDLVPRKCWLSDSVESTCLTLAGKIAEAKNAWDSRHPRISPAFKFGSTSGQRPRHDLESPDLPSSTTGRQQIQANIKHSAGFNIHSGFVVSDDSNISGQEGSSFVTSTTGEPDASHFQAQEIDAIKYSDPSLFSQSIFTQDVSRSSYPQHHLPQSPCNTTPCQHNTSAAGKIGNKLMLPSTSPMHLAPSQVSSNGQAAAAPSVLHMQSFTQPADLSRFFSTPGQVVGSENKIAEQKACLENVINDEIQTQYDLLDELLLLNDTELVDLGVGQDANSILNIWKKHCDCASRALATATSTYISIKNTNRPIFDSLIRMLETMAEARTKTNGEVGRAVEIGALKAGLKVLKSWTAEWTERLRNLKPCPAANASLYTHNNTFDYNYAPSSLGINTSATSSHDAEFAFPDPSSFYYGLPLRFPTTYEYSDPSECALNPGPSLAFVNATAVSARAPTIGCPLAHSITSVVPPSSEQSTTLTFIPSTTPGYGPAPAYGLPARAQFEPQVAPLPGWSYPIAAQQAPLFWYGPPAAPMIASPFRTKKTRDPRPACVPCRNRHDSCDKQLPCKECVQRKIPCHYTGSLRAVKVADRE